MTTLSTKLKKVGDSITINRYDNGWMVEVGGRDSEGDWKTAKIMCSNDQELVAIIKEYNGMEID